MIKQLAMRTFDVAIICALIFGDQDMQIFGLWIAGLFTVSAWFLVYTLKPDAAMEIHGSLFKVVIGSAVNLAYTYALIASGSPIWAAFYFLGSILVRFSAAKMANAPSA